MAGGMLLDRDWVLGWKGYLDGEVLRQAVNVLLDVLNGAFEALPAVCTETLCRRPRLTPCLGPYQAGIAM